MAIAKTLFLGLWATVIALAFASLCCGSAQAAVSCSRYASPAGNDAATGTLEAPFRTAQRLVTALQPGETGCLRQGDYGPTGTYVLDALHGGTAGAPITVTSYPGERATIQGITQIPNGSSYVTLSNLDFEGSAGMQTVKIYSGSVHFEGNDVTNNGRSGSCMMLGSTSAGLALQPVISGNVFHGCGSLADGNKDHGIYASDVMEGTIVNNLFFDSAAYAIQLYPNAQKTTFAHNVIDGSAPSIRGGLVFGGDESYASSENVVEQNVIAFAATYDIASVWSGAVGSGNIARNNCVYGAGTANLGNGGGLIASNNLTADPLFLDAAADDFRLSPVSPCLAMVGYDTVALIESGGILAPGEDGPLPPILPSEGEGPDEGSASPPAPTPVAETPNPTSAPTPAPTSAPTRPGAKAGDASTATQVGGAAESSAGTSIGGQATDPPRRCRRVSLHAHRTSNGVKMVVKGKVLGACAARSIKIDIAAASGWHRTLTGPVSTRQTFAVRLPLPSGLGRVSVKASAESGGTAGATPV